MAAATTSSILPSIDCKIAVLEFLIFCSSGFSNRPLALLEMVESVDAEDNEEGDGFVPSDTSPWVCNATCIVELPAFSIVFLIMGSAFRW